MKIRIPAETWCGCTHLPYPSHAQMGGDLGVWESRSKRWNKHREECQRGPTNAYIAAEVKPGAAGAVASIYGGEKLTEAWSVEKIQAPWVSVAGIPLHPDCWKVAVAVGLITVAEEEKPPAPEVPEA